jgi:hypothetical protein
MVKFLTLSFLALLLPVALISQTPKHYGGPGTLKLNVAKSKFNPGPGPTSATVTTGDDGKLQVQEVQADGKSTPWSVTPTKDGTPAPVTGMGENATLVRKIIDERHIEDTWSVGGQPAVGKAVWSKDGKTLTYTLNGKTADGKPRHDVLVYEKQ